MGATLTAKGGKIGGSALIGYVNRHGEIDEERLYAKNLSIENQRAQKEMKQTREHFGKTGGIQAHHWVQSFDKELNKNNPKDIQKAHEIGADLVDKLSARLPNHEIYMTTHTDSKSGFIHNHIVVGAIDLETGKKLHSDKTLNYDFKEMNDQILHEHGLTQPKEKFHDKDFELAKKGQKSKREEIKEKVLQATEASLDFQSFEKKLNQLGISTYRFNKGKRIGYTLKGKECDFSIGARKLGADYEPQALEQRFLANQKEHYLNQPQKKQPQQEQRTHNKDKLPTKQRDTQQKNLNTSQNPFGKLAQIVSKPAVSVKSPEKSQQSKQPLDNKIEQANNFSHTKSINALNQKISRGTELSKEQHNAEKQRQKELLDMAKRMAKSPSYEQERGR